MQGGLGRDYRLDGGVIGRGSGGWFREVERFLHYALSCCQIGHENSGQERGGGVRVSVCARAVNFFGRWL